MKLEAHNVVCGYGANIVVRDISLTVASGEVVCLLGPNGVGKTTLFKAILGLLPIQSGEIRLEGENVRHWPRDRFARAVAYVPQAHIPPFPFSVLDVVLMGRTAHLGGLAAPSPTDHAIVDEALELLGIAGLKHRIYTEISGGERQMVLIARALAQQAGILVMDEPTASLDFGNQIKVLNQIQRLVQSGIGVLLTTHFPDHALLCATKVALMQRNHVFQVGDTAAIMTEANLRAAYGVPVKIITTTTGNGAVVQSCVPLIHHVEIRQP